MSPSTRKEENRLNLLNEGMRAMMLQGYHGTGVKELVDAVGVPKGSFYQYFHSKEHFGASVISHYVAPYIVRLKQHLEQNEGDALAGMLAYFDELNKEAALSGYQGGCLLGNLLGEIGDTEGVCQQALKTAVNIYCAQLEVGLKRAQSEGTITKYLPAKEMATLLFDAWQGAQLRMKVTRSVAPLEECVEKLLNGSFKNWS